MHVTFDPWWSIFQSKYQVNYWVHSLVHSLVQSPGFVPSHQMDTVGYCEVSFPIQDKILELVHFHDFIIKISYWDTLGYALVVHSSNQIQEQAVSFKNVLENIILLGSRHEVNLVKRRDSGRCSKICSPATPVPKWWFLRPSPWLEVEELGLWLILAPSPVTVLLTHDSWLLMEVCGAVFILVATVD